jgi:hypothetical protein
MSASPYVIMNSIKLKSEKLRRVAPVVARFMGRLCNLSKFQWPHRPPNWLWELRAS